MTDYYWDDLKPGDFVTASGNKEWVYRVECLPEPGLKRVWLRPFYKCGDRDLFTDERQSNSHFTSWSSGFKKVVYEKYAPDGPPASFNRRWLDKYSEPLLGPGVKPEEVYEPHKTVSDVTEADCIL